MVRRLCIFLFPVAIISYVVPVVQHYQSGHVLPAGSHSTADSEDPPTVSFSSMIHWQLREEPKLLQALQGTLKAH